jgi:hypothetical protein
MKSRPLHLNESICEMLMFLWKWKISTTSLLAARFWPNRSLKTAYNRLMQLADRDYLDIRVDPSGTTVVWTLGKNGYQLVLQKLPQLRARGFRSEYVAHDLLVQAFHLGNWTLGEPEGAELFTEQQLRCFDMDMYPSWVPRSDLHRADGYIRVPNGSTKRTIALEVELSRKSAADYKNIARFYDRYRVDHVLWLVPNKIIENQILRAVESHHNNLLTKHSIIYVSSFIESGWEAESMTGNQYVKIADRIGELAGKTKGDFPIQKALNAKKIADGTITYETFAFARDW